MENLAFQGNFLSMSVADPRVEGNRGEVWEFEFIPCFHDAWVSVGCFAPDLIR